MGVFVGVSSKATLDHVTPLVLKQPPKWGSPLPPPCEVPPVPPELDISALAFTDAPKDEGVHRAMAFLKLREQSKAAEAKSLLDSGLSQSHTLSSSRSPTWK